MHEVGIINSSDSGGLSSVRRSIVWIVRLRYTQILLCREYLVVS